MLLFGAKTKRNQVVKKLGAIYLKKGTTLKRKIRKCNQDLQDLQILPKG